MADLVPYSGRTVTSSTSMPWTGRSTWDREKLRKRGCSVLSKATSWRKVGSGEGTEDEGDSAVPV